MKLAAALLAALASRRLAVPHGVELHHRHRRLGADLHGRGGGAQSHLRLHRAAVLRPARLLGHRRLRHGADGGDLRRQLLVGPRLGGADQRRRGAGRRLSDPAHQPPRLRHRHAHLRPAGDPDRARLGRPHARAARHSQPAAAHGLRLQLRHHGAVLLDRLGLRGGDARLPLCAVQLAHRPHPDRHQAERAAGARPGHLADALQARLLRHERRHHRRGGRRLLLPSPHHRSAVPRLLLHADLPDHRDHRRRRQLLGRGRRRASRSRRCPRRCASPPTSA